MFGVTDLEVVMSFRAKQSWPRRAALAGAVLANTALAVGVMPQPAAAQYAYDYGYGYPGPAYLYPPQPYSAHPSYRSYGQQHSWGGDWGTGRHSAGVAATVAVARAAAVPAGPVTFTTAGLARTPVIGSPGEEDRQSEHDQSGPTSAGPS